MHAPYASPRVILLLSLIACTKGPPVYKSEDTSTAEDSGTPVDTDSAPDHVPDASDAIYTTERVLEIEILMDGGDWEALKEEQRNVMEIISEDCLASPWESPYSWYAASVTVDGRTREDAALRKKGLLGSESTTKPSLKVSFDEFSEGGSLFGLDGLTLNNARQDPSYIHQCMGYALFEAAGIPSSRCGFAHVTVNGEDLGIYANIEPVDKDFLRRRYVDAGGDLYEGRLSDFREGWLDTFEKKTNEDEPGRAELQALADALLLDDDGLLPALETRLDLEVFLTYWAMEILTGHWDSYAANTNNFFVYVDPASGLLYFHPWGIDAVLDAEEPFGAGMSQAVSAWGALCRRLYVHPVTRDLYLARLGQLLDEVWHEDALLAEVDRLSTLVEPFVERSARRSFLTSVETTREVIAGKRARIETELAAGPPPWDYELRGYPCLSEVGAVAGTFSSTWGDWDLEAGGEATMTFTYFGEAYPLDDLGVFAGTGGDGDAYIAVQGTLSWGADLLLYLILDPEDVAPGALPVDWHEVTSYLYYRERGSDWGLAAYVYGGELVLDAAGSGNGDPVGGSFSAGVWGSTG
jgi:hypothetical protein